VLLDAISSVDDVVTLVDQRRDETLDFGRGVLTVVVEDRNRGPRRVA